MDDPGRVRLGEAVGDLGRDVQNPAQRHRARGVELSECLTLNELHRDEGVSRSLPDVVDRDDVRMVQRRRGARFPLEALQALVLGARRSGRRP